VGSPRPNAIAIAIVLVSLAATAFFLAQGTTGLLAATFLPVEPGGAVTLPTSTRSTPGRASRDDTAILRRNIFDHEQGPLDGVDVADVVSDDEVVRPTNEVDWTQPPPVCDGSVRLVAAVVNPISPDWSFAAIVGAAGKALLYRRGQSVDGRQVIHIFTDRVYLQPTTGACQITMFGEEVAQGPRVSAPPVNAEPVEVPSAGESEGGINASEMESGIQRVSDTNFNIDRSLVDRVLENQAELMRTARVIPHEENGRTVGVKLYGIRRNSLLGRLGVQNGDMLRTINGYDMSSPDTALEAYARLRTADHLTLSIVRRGQPTTIDYNIR
jgi:general secretion pathway protein C